MQPNDIISGDCENLRRATEITEIPRSSAIHQQPLSANITSKMSETAMELKFETRVKERRMANGNYKHLTSCTYADLFYT